MLNGGSLNSGALNSPAFSGAEGEGILVSFIQDVLRIEQGVLVNLEQYVAFVGQGAIMDIAQEVELRISGSGTLIELDQTVTTQATSGSLLLLEVEQKVPTPAEAAFYDKNGWDLVVSLGGFNIPRDTIQECEVVHGINDDSRAIVKLNPRAATYNLYSYQGRPLIISVRTTGGFQRIFTGIVDIPRVEVVNEKIILEGVSVRETLIRNTMTPFVAGIGYYSETVFGPRNNVYQEMNDRMSTIPYDLDFDPYGNWSVTSWTPKGTADITLGNSALYREREPEVRIESAREVVNRVGIVLNYAYQRLHQASLSYNWNPGLQPCDYLTTGNTLPNREMVRNAAGSAGWRVTNMSFTDLWPSGWYHCGGVSIGWVNSFVESFIRNNPATDGSGNNYSNSQMISTFNINQLLCQGAQWTCKKRFTQNVQETYILTVDSPQSQALYGVREKNENLSLQAEFDASQWEDESLYDTEFSGTKIAQSTTNYYVNMDTENTELNNAMTTMLNKSRTTILASHRDTEIAFTTFVNPNYQLRHTIRLNTTRIEAKGKVRGIVHKFTPDGEATSTVRLALYRSVGSQADSALVPVTRPSFAAPPSMGSVVLGSRWGQDPSQSGAANWNGYVGNKWVTSGGGFNTNTYKTTYQESFIVDTPSIPANRRDQQNYSRSGSYNIGIPTDSLTITFVDS
jgi:hypothetical protein